MKNSIVYWADAVPNVMAQMGYHPERRKIGDKWLVIERRLIWPLVSSQQEVEDYVAALIAEATGNIPG